MGSFPKDVLVSRAREVCLNAYAPYSGYRVGAALVSEAGRLYSGCNVENVSYGLSVCAERNAVAQAISAEGPKMRIREILVLNRDETFCTPCGVCRQVLYEFGPHATLFFRRGDAWQRMTISQLLPETFEFTPSQSSAA